MPFRGSLVVELERRAVREGAERVPEDPSGEDDFDEDLVLDEADEDDGDE